jgi:hypothetical protein
MVLREPQADKKLTENLPSGTGVPPVQTQAETKVILTPPRAAVPHFMILGDPKAAVLH